MFKVKLGIVFVACLLFFAVEAKADSFNLTATNGTTTVISATLTGTQLSPGVFDITGMSGTVDGQSVTLLPTSGVGVVTASSVVNGWEILYDDLLNLKSTNVDYYGLGFQEANGTLGNLYFSGGYLYAELGANPPFQEQVSISVVQTPEPSSLVLLVSGMLALMLLVIRRGRV